MAGPEESGVIRTENLMSPYHIHFMSLLNIVLLNLSLSVSLTFSPVFRGTCVVLTYFFSEALPDCQDLTSQLRVNIHFGF